MQDCAKFTRLNFSRFWYSREHCGKWMLAEKTWYTVFTGEDIMFFDKNQQVFNLIHITCVTAQGIFFIQLNADSLYPFACRSLCLLCLLILMLIILMLILIESRSILIVYWLGDRKLINAYLTKNSMQNVNLPKEFLKIK